MKKTKVYHISLSPRPLFAFTRQRAIRSDRGVTNTQQCDGEFPGSGVRDDGLVCTAGTRKKTEYKQLPRGCGLPHCCGGQKMQFPLTRGSFETGMPRCSRTRSCLIATVHKLYAMVRNNQQWELGEPELNKRGQPVIHNIASKLGCIRPNSDIDLVATVSSRRRGRPGGAGTPAGGAAEGRPGAEHEPEWPRGSGQLVRAGSLPRFDDQDYRRRAFRARRSPCHLRA